MPASTEGIQAPVAPALHGLLRRAVLDHRAAERRRAFAPRLHVGRPGGVTEVLACGPEGGYDHALRADVVAAMLARALRRDRRVPMVWLTRPGDLSVQDVDAAWVSGARTAAAEAGVRLTLVVVTRQGWLDPRSGVGRTWTRLRDRSGER
ncbi:hypothetical protein [Nocardioides mangrovi]|uniref:Uncharacterized protein n=1 Tax=Nocardioides mangrovi TaxID=2874580 RepID=A0ABS7U8G3_9ACTN|nr:hypothetical protein [Nocardioides mangrovi]MBZ5736947.1 hypothetical protein [Nocardioides mangrovi]